jgi:hypothetical protein
MAIGKRVLRQMLSVETRLCGQLSGSPNGVADQSIVRIKAPTLPPAAKIDSSSLEPIAHLQPVAFR